jgi:hypothetical protein
MSRCFGSTYGAGTSDSIKTNATFTPSTSALSIAGWFYINALGGSGAGAGYSFANGSAAVFGTSTVSNAVSFFAAWTGSSGGNAIWHAPATFGQWNHICATYSGSSSSNKPTIYVNGISQTVTAQVPPSGSINFSSGAAYAGNSAAGNNNADGMIAHAAFWNGIILTASEAVALANGVNPLLIHPDSLTYYLPLDGVNSPEPDLIKGCSASLTGTRLGKSDPPAQSATAAITPTLIDMPINNSTLPWRRPGLTYRRIAA